MEAFITQSIVNSTSNSEKSIRYLWLDSGQKTSVWNLQNEMEPSKISLCIFASVSILLALAESVRPRTNTSLVLSVKFPVVHFPP